MLPAPSLAPATAQRPIPDGARVVVKVSWMEDSERSVRLHTYIATGRPKAKKP